ncbi:MAG: zinc-ribbon domain-containing protein, partial [Tritonibacter mobilis]|nr:zinc-ribbon domain-containing protein [Tritonibacter mobilis]
MRLICPNCGAQYEVPEDVIPENGRDVQCSNCGDTWFQPSAQMLADQDEAKTAPAAPARQPEP